MSDRLNGKNMPIQMLLMRSGHLLKYQMFSLLEQYDMNPGQVGILFILERYGNLSQRQLARIAGISPPSMTVALRKMEEKGLIVRTPDADDQRKIRIDLTDAGRARIGDMRQLLYRTQERMLDGFCEEEKLLLRRFLLQIEDNILHSGDMEEADLSGIFRRMHQRNEF